MKIPGVSSFLRAVIVAASLYAVISGASLLSTTSCRTDQQ